jgi:uncharacterized membrane protein YphA (DoxX/SURF4 family)
MVDPELASTKVLGERALKPAKVSLLALARSSPGVRLALRAALASPFLASGLLKLADWDSALAEFTALGIWAPQMSVAAVILTQVCGSLLLLAKRAVWLGAVTLALFTALATLIAHPFWLLEGGDRVRQLTTFLEHVAIIGGLAAAAVLAGDSRQAGRPA